MMRIVTSLMWLCVALVFSFDAIAQPCDVRAEMMSVSAPVAGPADDMPCHGDMAPSSEMNDHEMPMQDDTCCCAALLTHVPRLDQSSVTTPLLSVLVWAEPLPQRADSISFEYEPPPPRA